jgi:hypothetical protein
MIEAGGIKNVADGIQLAEFAPAILSVRQIDRDPPNVSLRQWFARQTDYMPVSKRKQTICDTAADQSGCAGDEGCLVRHGIEFQIMARRMWGRSIGRSARLRPPAQHPLSRCLL